MTKRDRSQTEETHAVVTAPYDGTVTPSAPARECSLVVPFGTPLVQCPTNIPRDTYQGKMMLVNAMGDSSIVLDKQGCAEFRLRYYLSHPGETPDPETGELHRHNRLVLMTEDGESFVTTSDVIPQRIEALIAIFGGELPEHGVRVAVRETKARRSGRTYHDLRVLPDAE